MITSQEPLPKKPSTESKSKAQRNNSINDILIIDWTSVKIYQNILYLDHFNTDIEDILGKNKVADRWTVKSADLTLYLVSTYQWSWIYS